MTSSDVQPGAKLDQFTIVREIGSGAFSDVYLAEQPGGGQVVLKVPHESIMGDVSTFDRFRRELKTDYIDILLLHCMMDADWPERKKGAMDVLSEAREKGIVRTHGASIHSLEALQTAAKTPWCKVQLQGINFAGVRMDSPDPAVVVAALRQSKAAGNGVLGMKVLGEGALKDRMDETLRFVLGLDCVDCFTIGAGNRDELAELIKRIPQNSVAA